MACLRSNGVCDSPYFDLAVSPPVPLAAATFARTPGRRRQRRRRGRNRGVPATPSSARRAYSSPMRSSAAVRPFSSCSSYLPPVRSLRASVPRCNASSLFCSALVGVEEVLGLVAEVLGLVADAHGLRPFVGCATPTGAAPPGSVRPCGPRNRRGGPGDRPPVVVQPVRRRSFRPRPPSSRPPRPPWLASGHDADPRALRPRPRRRRPRRRGLTAPRWSTTPSTAPGGWARSVGAFVHVAEERAPGAGRRGGGAAGADGRRRGRHAAALPRRPGADQGPHHGGRAAVRVPARPPSPAPSHPWTTAS